GGVLGGGRARVRRVRRARALRLQAAADRGRRRGVGLRRRVHAQLPDLAGQGPRVPRRPRGQGGAGRGAGRRAGRANSWTSADLAGRGRLHPRHRGAGRARHGLRAAGPARRGAPGRRAVARQGPAPHPPNNRLRRLRPRRCPGGASQMTAAGGVPLACPRPARTERMSAMPWHGLARRFPVLGYRDFRLLLADRVLAPGAFAFSLVGVSFAVLDATGSTADLSYVLAAQILPSLVFALVGGVFADRFAPQRVIVAANLMIAAGEGGFGLLVLLGQPQLWQMIGLETLTGAGMAVFYPASQALLPRLVPDRLLQEASALSRLAMNAAQMAGAAIAGAFVAAAGPGWALATCGIGMLGTVPLLLAIRAPGAA